jgi:hypothetical protein
VGANVPASLSGAPVVARAFDTHPAHGAEFNVVYVDAASEPDHLYVGDTSADSSRDGTTPAKRPLVLADWWTWTRLSPLGESTTTIDAVQGTWVSCYNEGNGASDVWEELTISGTTATVVLTHFPQSFDGRCQGVFSSDGPLAASVTLGVTAPATLLDRPVAAREVDIQPALEPFTVAWVDASATPPLLYTGDEIADPYRDASAPDRRPTVLQAGRPRAKLLP